MKTYHIDTMGCQMNERDSETIVGILEELSFEKADCKDAADIIIVNTCSVRENADNKFYGILGQIKSIKNNDPSKIVAVCGCMMQQKAIVDDIRKRFGWVDIVFGTQNIDELPGLLSQIGAVSSSEDKIGQNKAVSKAYHVLEDMPEIIEGLPSKRALPFKAFVNIMYGCNNFCSYCIVPYTRGREKSRAPEAIVREAKSLCDDGVREITLLGQNVNSYRGMDGASKVMSFPELITQISQVQSLDRIRFMTSHPKDISDELITLFRYGALPNLCPSIHLPVQSGSSRILNLMNRGYTKERYIELIEKIRDANPDIVITTDLIVGFPGETEEDFNETLDLIERVRFDSAFTFLYSKRSGTPAAELPDQVEDVTKHERFNRMVDLLNSITLDKNKLYIDRTEQILIEKLSKTRKDMLAGRTFGGKLVNISSPHEKQLQSFGVLKPEDLIGKIVPVKIENVNTFSFMGSIV